MPSIYIYIYILYHSCQMLSRVPRQRVSSGDAHTSGSFGLPKHHSSPPKAMSLVYPRLKWAVPFIVFAFIVCLLIVRTFRPEEWQPSPPYAGPHPALVEDGVHGFLPLHEARDFCQRRRWEPYATRDHRRKVYDLFLINTELDFLEIRLNELDKEVDYFVVLESNTTFQMNPKPLHLQDNIHKFNNFQHKIIHRILDDSGAKKIPKDDTWEHERYTRYVYTGLSFISFYTPVKYLYGQKTGLRALHTRLSESRICNICHNVLISHIYLHQPTLISSRPTVTHFSIRLYFP